MKTKTYNTYMYSWEGLSPPKKETIDYLFLDELVVLIQYKTDFQQCSIMIPRWNLANNADPLHERGISGIPDAAGGQDEVEW